MEKDSRETVFIHVMFVGLGDVDDELLEGSLFE